MIIFRSPAVPTSRDLFYPYTHAPSIAYWLLQPDADVENESTKTTLHSNETKNNAIKQQQPDNAAAKKRPAPTAAPSLGFPLAVSDFDISEEDGHYILSTDLPGVKHEDLKVEFKDSALFIEAQRKKGKEAQTYLRKLAVDEDSVDVASFVATLEDGILTLKAPKKKTDTDKENTEGNTTKSTRIPVYSKAVPEDKGAAELNLELDLPGVRADDLTISIAKDGMLSVVGERKRRGSSDTTKIAEAYMLNTRKVDTAKLEAYLSDGVLTVRAPPKQHVTKLIAVNGKLPPPKVEDVKEDEEKKDWNGLTVYNILYLEIFEERADFAVKEVLRNLAWLSCDGNV